MDADLLWIIVQPGTDNAKAVRGQTTSLALVVFVLLVLLIFLV